ncbi:ATP-binding cassette domain-containing protein [Rhodobacter sp. SGA-6-6]|uniref:ABC transporter ATP-binding protein n=1 Tax=Rhodobacter sp. SGA-6-6 TaxID=2710882 RepID=UPI0013EA8D77|nr:oligopeptide/dipeptide ABC transporter ATP-binding protein [Rhodobacter sp. SGA-6-6]NGM45951.1 ATP-binding cassette domain-containing protein [Rhodobacter sp. SGA-6-6]
MEAAAPLVSVRQLGRSFDVSAPAIQRLLTGSPRRSVRAVDDVSFAVDPGTTFAIVGESGCGKSTLTRLVAGLDSPTEGEVRLRGRDGGPVRIQMVFQDPVGSLNARWRIGRSIAEPMPKDMDAAARRARVAELLQTVGLSPGDAAKYPHEFSGGQRQRIAIARALAGEADLLLLDEPTSALDVSVQAQVLNLLKDLQDRLGLTYLFISHNLAVVRFMADRLGIMYLGRMVEEGPAEVLFGAPAHPYTRQLMATVPDVDNPQRDREPVAFEIPSPLNMPPGCTYSPRCPLAMEICRRERPMLRDRTNGTRIACHAVEG